MPAGAQPSPGGPPDLKAPTTATPSAPGRGRAARSRASWALAVLLVASVAINYIDRGNLSVAATPIQSEMALSPAQLGVLLSSFFWTYAVLQLAAGWLAERFDASAVLAAGFVLWSAATAVTGAAGGFGALLVLRLVVGAGESVAYPCYSKILTACADERQRGVVNAWIDAGSKLGPAIGLFAGGVLVARFGWRPFFVVLGLGALLWLPFWMREMPRRRTAAAPRSGRQPGIREILGHRAIWPTFIGHFCGNYFWYFLLTWLPYYLIRARHLSMDAMAVVAPLALLSTAAATVSAGWISSRALAAGATPTRVRKTCTVLGLGFAVSVVAVPAVQGTRAAVALLVFSGLAYGVFASSHWTITQTIAGPLAAGRWSGMQNFVANLAGVVAPAVTGFVVDRTGHFFWAFAAVGAVALIGAAAYLFGLGAVEPASWRCEAG